MKLKNLNDEIEIPSKNVTFESFVVLRLFTDYIIFFD